MLEHFMQSYDIDILCLQETHRCEHDISVTSTGYLVILSGHAAEKHAGVGFMLAPHVRQGLYSYDCMDARMAAIKLRGSDV